MKLYIGPCGLGLGHITRCERIAREFSSRGDDVIFSSYLDGLDYLRRTGLRHFSAFPISFRTREDGTIDPKLTATRNGVTVGLWKFVKQLLGEIKQIGGYQPDVVISDTRVSTLLAAILLRRPTCLILNQYSVQMPNHTRPGGLADGVMLLLGRIIWKYASTLLGLVWGMSDAIIVPDLEYPYTISAYNLSIPPRIARKVKLVGPMTQEAQKSIPNGVSTSPAKSQTTIFACVSGPAADRKYLVRVLSQVLGEFPEEWKVVLSCGDPNGSSIPRMEGTFTVFEWMNEALYDETFKNANVIIARAGHETIMKSIALGKPLVLIPPPNHTEQTNNAQRAMELGVGLVLPQGSLDSDILVKAVLESMEKCGERAVEISRILSAHSGTEAVVKTVYGLARVRF